MLFAVIHHYGLRVDEATILTLEHVNLKSQAMIEYPNYDRAVIVTSDGDFACLVRYLDQKAKLGRVLSPTRERCSTLLRQAARARIDFLEGARSKLEYKRSEGAPRQD